MIFTQEQQKAIDFDNGGAIVSAAAGSGKTAILVERIMRIISDEKNKIPADRLVITTFTNKAAAEIRQRISKALKQRTEADKNNSYLRQQFLRLQSAKISTISSFCLDIIRENIRYSENLDIGFGILNDAFMDVIESAASDAAMERFYSEFSEGEKNLLCDWFAEKNDNAIVNCIKNIYKTTRKLVSPEAFLDKYLSLYSQPDKLYDIIAPYAVKSIIKKAREAVALCRENCDRAGGMGKDALDMVLMEDFLYLKEFLTLTPETAKDDKKMSILLNHIFSRLPAKTADDDIKERRARIKKLSDELKSAIGLFAPAKEDIAAQYPVLKILVSLYGIYRDELMKIKFSKNMIDFDDIERMTLDILKDEKKCSEISSRYEVIIVDEFQDSNDIQYEIFRLLSHNGKNLFLVGDIKQSIYRFRGANPLVFSSVVNSDNYTSLFLNRNFRSNNSVISAVNDIFCGLMTKELGDVDYDENAKLVQGMNYDEEKDNFTELCFVEGEELKQEKAEAIYIAKRIREFIDSKTLVNRMNGADGNKSERPVNYGDIAVLARSVDNIIPIYKKVFSQYNIPLESNSQGKDFLSASETLLIINFLSVVDNPMDDIALLNVLMSPLFLFTADEIAEIRLSQPKGKLYGALLTVRRDSENPVGKKVAAFLDKTDKLNRYRKNHTVSDLIRYIFDNTEFMPIIALYDGAKQRRSNLRMFLKYANDFDIDGTSTLYDFLRYIKNVDKTKISSAKTGSSEDAVHIMTIHGSKGLEFPVCFVASAEKGMKCQDVSSPVLFDIDMGMGFYRVYRDQMVKTDTLCRYVVSEEIKAKFFSEEMRLLYVAATRAREKLIFVSAQDDDYKLSYSNWIKSSGALNKSVRINLCPVTEDTDNEVNENEQDDISKTAERIKDALNFKYKYELATKLPSKLTATQIGVDGSILEETTDTPTIFPRTPTFVKKSGLTGKKRGDAYHKVLELLDLHTDNVTEFIEKLKADGMITAEERRVVIDSDIEKYLSGALGTRIRNSPKVLREYPVFTEIGLDFLEINGESYELPFVQGIADMFFYEGDEIVLVDYKTNVNTTADILRREYSKQLLIYKKAIEEMTGDKVKACYIYSFFLNREISIDL